jgi:hypothetical protein
MFYSKYYLYDGEVEIMVPSYMKKTDAMLSAQYMWASNDGKIRINITQGSADLDKNGIDGRLSEYYHKFNKDTNGFKCRYIKKRNIYARPYGEIRYLSKMMGYDLFNMFLLGTYDGRELMLTIQCIAEDSNCNIRIFENIADSLKITRGDS